MLNILGISETYKLGDYMIKTVSYKDLNSLGAEACNLYVFRVVFR